MDISGEFASHIPRWNCTNWVVLGATLKISAANFGDFWGMQDRIDIFRKALADIMVTGMQRSKRIKVKLFFGRC